MEKYLRIALGAFLLCSSVPVWADEPSALPSDDDGSAAPGGDAEPPAPEPTAEPEVIVALEEGDEGTDTVTVTGDRIHEDRVEGRASHRTTRKQMERRGTRSTPDALRYTPGVYVQQTAHGQASPFIRGRTGRNTLMLFDGVPLNHALFRQGPNQYLFTVDRNSVAGLEVIRGTSTVELGAGAVSGAVLIDPIEPMIDPYEEGFRIDGRANYQYGSADNSHGARLQLDTQYGKTGFVGGLGFRRAGQLRTGGPVEGLRPAEDFGVIAAEKEVPRFEDDGRTQMGTGFDELAGDLRLVHRIDDDQRVTAAAYLYRQFDAPRTDQCPPPEAPDTWCLNFDEQFRTHAYLKADLAPKTAAVDRWTGILSFQRQHERRSNNRDAFINGGRDDINIYTLRLNAESTPWQLSDALRLRVHYGLNGNVQSVSSAGWITLTRTQITRSESRGQYVDGSLYGEGGLFISPRLDIGKSITVRTGLRLGMTGASVPEDIDSESRAVDDTWFHAVGNLGVEWRAVEFLTLLVNAEQGFRPPNLDDLSARQLTGQGYQLENPNLKPEQALTLEAGARVSHVLADMKIDVETWLFQTWLFDGMERQDAPCPASDLGCRSTRTATPVRLFNLDETAEIRGVEVAARVRPGLGFDLRTTLGYAWGEGPSPIAGEDTRPLSRIPPLNGTVELGWKYRPLNLYLGGAMRWAADQGRLSYGDTVDSRIPFGGTQGYTVFDLRGGVDIRDLLRMNVIFENVGDSAYRVHGSSINGPGRGVLLSLELKT